MRKLGRFSLTFLALAAALLALAVACEEEEEGTPTATPTAEVAVTLTVTPTPMVIIDRGIIDIILGVHGDPYWGELPSPLLAGLKAYFKYVNTEEGGVCGWRIVLKVEDDKYDPARAVEAVRKLVEEDQVYAIVAGVGTTPHTAVWGYLNERGVPDLWIMSGAHKFAAEPEKYPWSVPLLPDYYVEGTIIGRHISETMPGKKVGVIYQNDDLGKDEAAGLENGLDDTKNEVVAKQSFETTEVDIRSQIINVKDAGAEVVHCGSIPGYCSQLLETAQDIDWDAQFFMGYVNSDVAMFAYAPPSAVEGAITTQVNKMADWTEDSAVAKHHEIMEEYGDVPAGNHTIIGQVAGELTVEALSRTCDNLTREGLMGAVHSFQDYQADLMLPGITITLSETDHLPIEAMGMMKATVTEDGKGKWEYIGDVISFAEDD